MGRLGAIRNKKYSQATELSQLQEELRRVSEKLASREGELAEALVPRPKSPNNSAVQENHA
jgi:hypothetical protein